MNAEFAEHAENPSENHCLQFQFRNGFPVFNVC
jgi:hypothetical protein